MDAIAKYPDDPNARVLGEFSAAAVMAHEFGHRWLAFAKIRNALGTASTGELLGRGQAHWSFFLDTDGSVWKGTRSRTWATDRSARIPPAAATAHWIST
jgi:hypothetical protein